MAFRGNINNASLARLAEQLNLDVEQIFLAMQSNAVSTVIAENRALAQRMQINVHSGLCLRRPDRARLCAAGRDAATGGRYPAGLALSQCHSDFFFAKILKNCCLNIRTAG